MPRPDPAQGPTALAPLGDREELDPLAELFIHTARQGVNGNAMQIIVTKVPLKFGLMERAIHQTVPEFPILLSKPEVRKGTILLNAWKPEDVQFQEVKFEGPLHFEHTPFRRFLTNLSKDHPVDWLQTPPVRFWLIQSPAEPDRSCFLMTASHATADAKSDSMLLETLLQTYGALHGGAERRVADAPRDHSFRGLTQVLPPPKDRTGLGLWSVAMDAKREVLEKTLGLRSASKAVRRQKAREADFHREVLSEEMQANIHALSQSSGHTLNTLFTAALVRAMEPELPLKPGKDQRVKVIVPISMRYLAGPTFSKHYRNFMLPCRLSYRLGASSRELLSDIAQQISEVKVGGRVHLEIEKLKLMCTFLRNPVLHGLGLTLMDGFQQTSVAYSNPGVIHEDFRTCGRSDLPVEDYIGFGCALPPMDFILYTPKLHQRLELNAVYYPDAFTDFRAQIIEGVKRALRDMFQEFSISAESVAA
ncbi:hypothetical protein POL68_40955 [Stigmatella sp. ncwal1]|uniref:Condensation domain-containing protein n=1 Tax=Stigmatella ashevillensis TaxID=2995309 RepID=A0ABT5DP03_9BACT|nr:hypothetical protein [Stigmatella ashevillena]MDC0714890.1 hypothetical protein [Stigmatella ashevillena]